MLYNARLILGPKLFVTNAEVFKIEIDDIHQVAFPKSKHKSHVTSSFHNLPN